MLQTPSSWTWAWHTVLPPWKFDEVMSWSTLQSSLCSPALLACAVSPWWYLSLEAGQEPMVTVKTQESSSCVFISRTDRAPRHRWVPRTFREPGPSCSIAQAVSPPRWLQEGWREGNRRRGRKKREGRGIQKAPQACPTSPASPPGR